MQILLDRIDLFYRNVREGNRPAADAALRLMEKYGRDLELKVWRYASRIIIEGI